MRDTTSRDHSTVPGADRAERTADACRDVARILGFEAFETVDASGTGSEDVLAGRADGLIVLPLGARALVDIPETGPPPELDPDAARLGRAIDAVRSALADAERSPGGVLEAARTALRADELFYLRERDDRIQVTASPTGGASPAAVPAAVRSELRGISHTDPLDEGALRQLALVLRARSASLTAAFAGDTDQMELVVAGWHAAPPIDGGSLATLARVIAVACDVIEDRRGQVDELLGEDRARWAAEIHDGLTQALTSAVLELTTLPRRIDEDPSSASSSLADVTDAVRRSLLEVRGMLFDLADGSASAPEPLAAYASDVAERWKLPVDITIEGDPGEPPRPVTTAVHQVIREAIANAAKHASATGVHIGISSREGQLHVEVEDDGSGFVPDAVRNVPGHLGLQLVTDRVADAGGHLEIDSSPGHGTRVSARFPMER